MRLRRLLSLSFLVALASLLPSAVVSDAYAGERAKLARFKPLGCTAKWNKKNQRIRDADRDGRPNIVDPDIDGDGRANGRDADIDGDGIPNRRDLDVDADGIPNRVDRDIDSDRRANPRDRDMDGDGRRNARDRDMDGDALPNGVDPEIDGDCVRNVADADMDGDGVPNFRDDDADSAGRDLARTAQASPRRVAPQFFGVVNEYAFVAAGANRDLLLDQVVATGNRVIRQKFDWALIERERGVYDFSPYDAWMTAVAARGLEVLPILFNPPPFRSSAPPNPQRGTYPPASNGDFAIFARLLARRYGPGGSFWARHPRLPARPVRAWQIWNEPNVRAYWPSGPDPAAYVAMLRTVGNAIRDDDPGAEIVAGGLTDSPSNMAPTEFAARMYAVGAKGSFDTMGVHAYSSSPDRTLDIVDSLRRVMDGNGDSGRRLWVTEVGWADAGPPSQYTIGVEGQSEMIRRVYTALVGERDRLRLRGVIYYAWRDAPAYGERGDFWGLHTGLFDIGGAPKPALSTYVATLRDLSDPAAGS